MRKTKATEMKRLSDYTKVTDEDAQVAFEERRRADWGDSLAPLPWSHFVTLTFRPIRFSSPTATVPFESFRTLNAVKSQFYAWVRSLERRCQKFVGYFVAIERGSSSRLHIHALVQAPGLSCTSLRDLWAGGFSDVREYDPKGHAAYYVTKEIGRTVVDWDFRFQKSRKRRLRSKR